MEFLKKKNEAASSFAGQLVANVLSRALNPYKVSAKIDVADEIPLQENFNPMMRTTKLLGLPMLMHEPMRLIRFDNFREYGEIPRSDAEVEYLHLDDIEECRSKYLIVLVSHRWWSGEEDCPHPDKGTTKFWILVDALLKLKDSIDKDVTILIWIDYFCIDQDDELKKVLGIQSLPSYVAASDCLLTPYSDKIYPDTGWVPEGPSVLAGYYRSGDWAAEYRSLSNTPTEYFGRAWCRLEMYLGSNAPLPAQGYDYFNRVKCHLVGRPHFMVRDHPAGKPALNCLPHLSNTFLTKMDPREGALKNTDKDLPHIQSIMRSNPMKEEKIGFQGGMKDGKRHGQGSMVFENGDIYEGEWQNDQRHGYGVEWYATGNKYEGEFKKDQRHGHGIYHSVSGNRYVGQFKFGKFHGKGKYYHPSGARYEGKYVEDKRNGKGIMFFAKGARREGRYKDGEQHGKAVYFWADGDCREEYWRKGVCVKEGKRTKPSELK